MAAYGHICTHFMHHFGAQEVHETYSQCIHTQEASVHATPSLHSYGAAPPNFYAEGYSTNPGTWNTRTNN